MSQSDSEVERNRLTQKEIDLALASRTLPDNSSSSSDPKKPAEKKFEGKPKVDVPPEAPTPVKEEEDPGVEPKVVDPSVVPTPLREKEDLMVKPEKVDVPLTSKKEEVVEPKKVKPKPVEEKEARPTPLPTKLPPVPSTVTSDYTDNSIDSDTSVSTVENTSEDEENKRKRRRRKKQNDSTYQSFVNYRMGRNPSESVGTPLPVYRDQHGNVFNAIDHSGVLPNFMSDSSYKDKPRPVDPKRIDSIKKMVPVCKRDNFQQFKEALEEAADAYDWPSYILDPKAKTFTEARARRKGETSIDRMYRKEAYAVIWQKIHSDLKDHVRDEEKRGDAQNLYRRLRNVICRNNKEFALELEAKLSSIFKEGCQKRNIVEYGVAIKNANDQLKAVDQGFSDEKLVLLYKKGLPFKVTAVSIKLSKKKYGNLRKARQLVEEYARDTDIDALTFPNEFKYLTEDERTSKKEKAAHRSKPKEESKDSKDKKKLSSNASTIVCKYFKQGKCTKGKTCSFLHAAGDKNDKSSQGDNRSQKPCFAFPDCTKKDCPYSHDEKLCKKHNEEYEAKKNKESSSDSKSSTHNVYSGMNEVITTAAADGVPHPEKRTPKKGEKTFTQSRTESVKSIEASKKNCKYEKCIATKGCGYAKECGERENNETLAHTKEEFTKEAKADGVPHKEKNTKDAMTDGVPRKKEELTKDAMADGVPHKQNKKEVLANQVNAKGFTGNVHKTILDSGSMTHSVKNKNSLVGSSIQSVQNTHVVGVGGTATPIKHKGQRLLKPDGKSVQVKFLLKDVLVLPHSSMNIISVPLLALAGYASHFENDTATITTKDGKVLLTARLCNKLYVIEGAETSTTIHCNNAEEKSLLLKHEQLGHIHFDFCRTVMGLEPKSDSFPNPKCESCDMAKLPEKARDKEAVSEANRRGHALHMDMSPKHPPATDSGETRIVQFIDEYSKYASIEPCTYKSEAYHVIKDKITMIESLVAPTKVSRVRCDGAGELAVSKRLKAWYKKRGIKHTYSAPYQQYQNGLIERMVRTINEGARAMMLRANSPEGDWLLAKEYFVYLRNHFYVPQGQTNTPAIEWYGVDSAVLPEGVFGCKVLAKVYVRKKSGNPHEEKKSRACTFMGVNETCKAYRVRPYDGKKTARALRYAKTVSFYPKEFPYTHPDTPRPKTKIPTESEEEDDSSDASIDTDTDATSEEDDASETDSDNNSDGAEFVEDKKHNENDSKYDNKPGEQYRINKILKRKLREGVVYYRIRWEGEWKDTWEPEKNLEQDAIQDFEKKHPQKQKESESVVEEKEKETTPDTDTDTEEENSENRPLRRSKRLKVNALTILCHNFEEKKTKYEGDERLRAENLFKSRRQELDELFDKVGREIDPKTNKQQENSPYKTFWDEAFLKEFMALKELGVFELVRRTSVPKGMPIVRPVIVRKTKMKQHEDSIDKHKVRICADGSSQVIEPTLTYAPTVVFHSVMMVLMIACHYDLDLECLDIKNFYVRCEMGEEEVYMEQVPGWEEAPRGEYLYRLRKAMYGTKSASRKAQRKLTEMLKEAKFEPLKSDPMIFVREDKEEVYKLAIICAWSDDLLCAGDKTLLSSMRKVLHKNKFETVRTEEPKAYTGIQIDRERNKRWMKVHQTQYTKELLHRLKIFNPQKARSPMLDYKTEDQLKDMLERKEHAPDERVRKTYQQECGGLMWLVKTRPDIAFALTVVCRGMQNPIRSDLVRIKRVLDYIANTPDIGIVWQVQGAYENLPVKACNQLEAHADADLAARVDNSRSTSGYSVKFKDTGLIFAVSQLQKVVSLSTTHSELICACECTKTVEWCRGFLKELGLSPTEPTKIAQDNKPCIDLTNNAVYHFRTRHFRVAQHYLRELKENKIIEMIYTPSKEMEADFLNKTQPPHRHIELRIKNMNN